MINTDNQTKHQSAKKRFNHTQIPLEANSKGQFKLNIFPGILQELFSVFLITNLDSIDLITE